MTGLIASSIVLVPEHDVRECLPVTYDGAVASRHVSVIELSFDCHSRCGDETIERSSRRSFAGRIRR